MKWIKKILFIPVLYLYIYKNKLICIENYTGQGCKMVARDNN